MRDQEICRLKWEWEIKLYLQDVSSVFVIPGRFTKNGEDRLVVLNNIVQPIIEEERGKHSEYVFTYKGKPITRMLNKGWIRAREKAELPHVRVHDLKHTFGRRLRSAGVSFEDRQDLLGHKSATHYSAAELLNLLAAANKVCDKSGSQTLTLIRHVMLPGPAKVPQHNFAPMLKVV
jgi:integrase